MIVFGSGESVYTGAIKKLGACPNCKSGSWVPVGTLEYFHVFWIPFFVYLPEIGLVCESCKTEMEKTKIDENTKMQIKRELFTPTRLMLKFIGVYLIIGFIALQFFVFGPQLEEQFANPKVDDVYIVNLTDMGLNDDPLYRYGMLRVKNIENDAILFDAGESLANFSYTLEDDLDDGKAKNDEYWTTYGAIKKSDLKKAFDDGNIEDIFRDWR